MTSITSYLLYTKKGEFFFNARLSWMFFYACMIVVNVLIYQHLHELEADKCDCSKKYRRYLQHSIVVKVFFMVSEVIALSINPNNLVFANIFYIAASLISTMIYYPLSILYVMNASDCECARNWKEFLFFFSFF